MYIKDPRHPLTFTFYDSTLQHAIFNAMWNSSYCQYDGVYLCGAMGIVSVKRPAGPGFEYTAGLLLLWRAVKFEKLIFSLKIDFLGGHFQADHMLKIHIFK